MSGIQRTPDKADADADARAEAWAERIAAQLPPFTADEIADLGRLAATIDARRAEKARAAAIKQAA